MIRCQVSNSVQGYSEILNFIVLSMCWAKMKKRSRVLSVSPKMHNIKAVLKME